MSNGDLNEIGKIAVGIKMNTMFIFLHIYIQASLGIFNSTSKIVYSYVELMLPQFYDDRNALV